MIHFAFRFILVAVLLAAHCPVPADEGRKLPIVGLAASVDPTTAVPYHKALRDGLQDLGYIDGKNMRLIELYSYGDRGKLRGIIRELVALKVDVLMGDAPGLKEATTTLPLVAPIIGGDPVKTGLVASLARPGGNLTGLSYQRYDMTPKLLELTKELLPGIKRLCLLFDDYRERDLVKYANGEFRALAQDIGVTVCLVPVRTAEDIRAAPNMIDRERPQAVMVWASGFIYQHLRTLLGALTYRIPVIGDGREEAEAGAVLSYSVDYLDMWRRSAAYVDKILRGAKPGDLPIEQPTKFKLVVNLKTAKTLDVKIPESIMVRADEIIR